jgi:hypothetical protein
MDKGDKDMNQTKQYAIKRRKNNIIVRRCSTLKHAQQLAITMNQLCGNQTAFHAVRLINKAGK